ncbi:MAG: hypothetical protein FGM54_04755 [Chitinophagaceae bacterium]|nr:hypothetical protein [Chitinophagaceae bacterium]
MVGGEVSVFGALALLFALAKPFRLFSWFGAEIDVFGALAFALLFALAKPFRLFLGWCKDSWFGKLAFALLYALAKPFWAIAFAFIFALAQPCFASLRSAHPFFIFNKSYIFASIPLGLMFVWDVAQLVELFYFYREPLFCVGIDAYNYKKTLAKPCCALFRSANHLLHIFMYFTL